MARALKVFRTAIGFHDAYVAAPTMKAALEAWGADRNLFASGRAEIVTDAKLTKAPLADPGKVIKVLRGTEAEQFAALEMAAPRRPPAKRAAADPPPKPAPRPSRAALDRADKALAAAEARHDKALAALAKREAELREQRRALERKRDTEIAALEDHRDREKDAYDEALSDWRG
ncbi:MAG TPA: hypothetical protein VK533_14015 [Sphingomonas sp.]|uniref:hypothetical protein n=1 Tax=Sphingomonas sp. TaxID=28214 RepID=UPI002C37F502|nr:hypothetical protein [Sphingomonas sp.]HMI20649.1 hypothetical protein [Sphingomonas sp.]